MKQTLLFISLCLVVFKNVSSFPSNQEKLDSMIKLLSHAKSDTSQVKLLEGIVEELPSNTTDSKLKYANSALELSRKIKYQTGEANALYLIGSSIKDPSMKLDYYFKAINIFKQLNNKISVALVDDDIARIFSNLGDSNLAVNYGLDGLKIREELGDSNQIEKSWYTLKDIYGSTEHNPNTLKYLLLIERRKIQNHDLANIEWIYNNIAVYFRELGSYNKAIEYYTKALDIIKSNENREWEISINLLNQARTYHLMGNNQLAMEFYENAFNLFSTLKDDNNLCVVSREMGMIFLQQNQLVKAKQYFENSLVLSKKLKSNLLFKDIYLSLSKLDSALSISPNISLVEQRKYSIQSMQYYKLYINYSDSISTKELKQKAIQKNLLFEFQNKEAIMKTEQDKLQAIAISENKRQKFMLYSLLIGLMTTILFAIFVARSLRIRNKQNQIITEEKKKSDDLLLNILPLEVAEELKATGLSTAKYYENITVLFTDFVGFTSVSEILNATQLVEEINTCFTEFDRIIERNGLEKIKTIGDAYLAVCGLPTGNSDHALKTVQTAIEILEFINERKLQGGKFEIRIGVHSGSVVAGIVGVKKFAYDIWGDTVNTAARMEQNSESGKINISETTFELVKNQIKCKHRGKINAKNKGDIDMYFVEV